MKETHLTDCVCPPESDFIGSCPVHTPEHFAGKSLGYGGIFIKNYAGKYYLGLEDFANYFIWHAISADLYTLLERTKTEVKRYTPEDAYEEITRYAAYSIHHGDRIINNVKESELKKILKQIK